jgi:hypothetical protein
LTTDVSTRRLFFYFSRYYSKLKMSTIRVSITDTLTATALNIDGMFAGAGFDSVVRKFLAIGSGDRKKATIAAAMTACKGVKTNVADIMSQLGGIDPAFMLTTPQGPSHNMTELALLGHLLYGYNESLYSDGFYASVLVYRKTIGGTTAVWHFGARDGAGVKPTRSLVLSQYAAMGPPSAGAQQAFYQDVYELAGDLWSTKPTALRVVVNSAFEILEGAVNVGLNLIGKRIGDAPEDVRTDGPPKPRRGSASGGAALTGSGGLLTGLTLGARSDDEEI